MRNLAFALFSLLAAGLIAAEPTVTDVSVQQRWPWNGKVDIDYTLDCDDGETADIEVSVSDGTTFLTATNTAFSGDLVSVARGRRRITFDPAAAGLAAGTYEAFNATVTAKTSPLYLIVDLTKSASEDGLLTRVTRRGLESGIYGSCQTNPVSGIASLIWTGVTNAVEYSTTKLVLRRIPAATFKLGYLAWDAIKTGWVEPTTEIALTKPYYVGVYPVTQSQYNLIMNANPSVFKTEGAARPVESLTYQNMLSFCGKLSEMTGFTCGLPTYAQWEYAANTGFTTPFCSGVLQKYTSVTWESVLAAMVAPYGCCGRSSVTTDVAPDEGGTVKVGGYLPNGYGLYDVHGNVWEAVVDYYNASYDYATDPIDPTGAPTATENNKHMRVGGSFTMKAEYARAHYRGYDFAENKGNVQTGFRVVINPF